MTNRDFINLQTALGISGKELADKLGVTPAAVSKWRTEREIPPYIAKAMEKLVQHVDVVVPLDVLMACARKAEEQGITFERFLGNMFREAIQESNPPENVTLMPAPGLYDPAAGTEPTPGAMVADEPKDP